jgi:hypothetical protein
MKPSSFESAIRLQFDCLIRKVIDRTVKNYYRELGRRAKHEIPFCDVTETDLNHAGVIDEYSAVSVIRFPLSLLDSEAVRRCCLHPQEFHLCMVLMQPHPLPATLLTLGLWLCGSIII